MMIAVSEKYALEVGQQLKKRSMLTQLPHLSGTDALFSITYDFFRHYDPSRAKS